MICSKTWHLRTFAILIFAFLFTGSSVFGVWARFVHVDSCNNGSAKVELTLQDSNQGILRVTFPETIYSDDVWWSKQGWLISANDRLDESDQSKFRHILSKDQRENVSLAGLNSVELQEPIEYGKKYVKYDLTISIDSLKGKYFYFGLGKEISDGGFFYTLDLESLVTNGGCSNAAKDT